MQLRFALMAISVALGVFVSMLAFLEVGRRLGVREAEKRGTGARAGVGVVDAAVYSLLALLIGFAFSGATSRFDHRRQLVMQETEAIRTAWLRIATLPPEQQPAIREGLRSYVDALLDAYANPPATVAELRRREAVTRAQNEVWLRSVQASLADDRGEKARMLLLPSLNEMFSVVERERLARMVHPPRIIYLMLFLTALAAAMFAGYSMASGTNRNWLHIVGVTATISIALYVIIELEFPRLGLVRVDKMDHAIVELRETMEEPTGITTQPGG